MIDTIQVHIEIDSIRSADSVVDVKGPVTGGGLFLLARKSLALRLPGRQNGESNQAA